MKKFKVVKHFPLEFLSPDWKECYLDFNALTIDEYKEFRNLTNIDTEDSDAVLTAFDRTVEILKHVYISGKGIGADGARVDILPEDLGGLPLEVINGATSFLLQRNPTTA